jgi:hypothetical protein
MKIYFVFLSVVLLLPLWLMVLSFTTKDTKDTTKELKGLSGQPRELSSMEPEECQVPE